MKTAGGDPNEELFTEKIDFSDQWRSFFHSLRERSLLVVLCFALAILAAVGYLLKAERIYEASAVVEVEQGRKRVVMIEDVDPVDLREADYLRTIEASLKGQSLLNRVAERLSLGTNHDFLPTGKKEASRDTVLKLLDKMMTVELRRGTRLIDISAEHRNPSVAALLVTTLVDEYVKQEMTSRIRDVKLANEFLREEAERLRGRLQLSEEAVQAFKEKSGSVSVDERQDIVVEKLKEINGALTAASTERIRIETDANQAELVGNNPEALLLIPSIQGDALVLQIKTSIGEQEALIADLLKRYLEKHPKMIQAKSRLDELKKSLRVAALEAPSRLKLAAVTAAAREKSLQQALQGQEGNALGLNKQTISYDSLKREAEADRALYESVLARLKETSVVSQQMDSSAVRLLEEPLVPEKPSKPKPLVILLLGIVGGLASGFALVVLADFLDSSLKTVDQVEAATGEPVLAGIPAFGPKPKQAGNAKSGFKTAIIEEGEGRGPEAFRTLRAALLVSGDPEATSVVLVTSAIPGEGKTFIALNLAASLARTEAPTLFVDCDLRRASATDVLYGSRPPGISEYLLNKVDINSIVRPTVHDNLHAISAGEFKPQVAGMLSQPLVQSLIANLKANYTHVVIDSAPVHAVSDSLLLLRHVNSVVFVVRSGKTPRHAILRAISLARKAGGRIRGIALNMLPEKGRDYYHYQSDEYYYNSSTDKRERGRKKAA